MIPDRKRIGPVGLYRDWIAAAPILDGFVFRKLTPQGDRGVALVVMARAAAAGDAPELFSGHSLRAGFLTEAGRQGANLFKMKDHSRHKSIETVSGYVRDHEAYRESRAGWRPSSSRWSRSTDWKCSPDVPTPAPASRRSGAGWARTSSSRGHQ